MRTLRHAHLLLLLLAFPGLLAAQRPLGDEFQVDVQGLATHPRLAANASGEFVVTWIRYDAAVDVSTLLARPYAADGTPRTGEIVVATPLFASLDLGPVAIREDGSFVVLAVDRDPQGGPVLRARSYSPEGAFQKSRVVSRALPAQVAMAPRRDGGFVAAWTESGVRARAFGQDLAPLGPEIEVEPKGANPAVTVGPTGDFVVAFNTGDVRDPFDRFDDLFWVAVRRFAADGSPRGRPIKVSPTYDDPARDLRVGSDGEGNFLVAWSGTFGTAGAGTFLRRYSANGASLSRVLHFLPFTSSLAVGPRGNFVLAWAAPGNRGVEVFAQRFGANGVPLGPEISVSGRFGYRDRPQVAIGAEGGFVVAWQRDTGTGVDVHVSARRFRRK